MENIKLEIIDTLYELDKKIRSSRNCEIYITTYLKKTIDTYTPINGTPIKYMINKQLKDKNIKLITAGGDYE